MGRAREIADLIGGTTPDIILKTSDGAILNLQTSDTTVAADGVLGAINFQAPDEASGTDSILIASKIEAIAEDTFAADNNKTKLVFSTGASAAASEKMSIASTGATTITTTGNEDSLTLVSSDADSNSGPHLVLDRQSASPADNDFLGQVVFRGKNDAGETVDYATMRGFISDATDGEEGVDLDIITQVAGTTRNRLQFAENEAIVNTNQVDIDFRVESDGNANMLLVDAGNDAVLLGTTAATATFTLTSAGRAAVIHSSSSTNTQDLLNIVGNGNTTNNALRFWHGADVSLTGGTVVGTVTINSSSTAYNTSSDYRLKENVVTDWDATTRIKQLKPSRFNFKVDKDTTVDGFLAHEVSSIVPEAITGEKDAVDKDGNPEYQGIDQSKLVPILTKSLQEALTRIETLETKVSTLEGG